MNTYQEIKIQNKFQQLYAMFCNLSVHIIKRCGEKTGEGIIRRAVRKTGENFGSTVLAEHRRKGIKTNLHNFYNNGLNVLYDPRIRIEKIFDFEDRQNFEIHTCPFAQYHNIRGQGKIGSFFCDEFQNSAIGTYTENYGQLNLSKMLTCEKDNFCCFSAYFRPANTSEERARESFSSAKPLSDLIAEETIHNSTFLSLEQFMVDLYCNMYIEAFERCANEGACAIADGLKMWAQEAVDMLKKQAENTKSAYDENFASHNFPLSLRENLSINWNFDRNKKAKELMTMVVVNSILATFEEGGK